MASYKKFFLLFFIPVVLYSQETQPLDFWSAGHFAEGICLNLFYSRACDMHNTEALMAGVFTGVIAEVFVDGFRLSPFGYRYDTRGIDVVDILLSAFGSLVSHVLFRDRLEWFYETRN